MLKKKHVMVLCCSVLFAFGCETKVLRQDIPVSTSPMGATIYADGKMVGQTPSTVSLERTRNHILTLTKDNYQQKDVVITKRYQTNRVLRNAVMSGVNSGLFFKDKGMGLNSGFSSVSNQEETGEAYILVPSAVSVSLIPLNGPAPEASAAPVYSDSPSPDAPSSEGDYPSEDAEDLSAKDLLMTGAAAGAAQMKPVEKKWQTSSSTKSYVKPDGTTVTKKSGSSVSVGVNPEGIVNALDTLFQ